MIIPQTIAGLASADTLHDILLHEHCNRVSEVESTDVWCFQCFRKQNTMKIKIEQEDSDPKKPVEDESNVELPVLELFSNLSLTEKEIDPEDDKTTTNKDAPYIKEENESNDDEEIDASKLVCKGPSRNKINPGRPQNEPYAFPPQPSRAQTTFINGRQMAGSQVSEAVWIESHENEIPSSVTELSELQMPTPILENHDQFWTDIEKLDTLDYPEIDEFTADEISRVIGQYQNINNIETAPNVAVDEGFDEVHYKPAESFSIVQTNVSDSFSQVRLNVSDSFSGVQPNLSDYFSGAQVNSLDSNGAETNFLEALYIEDPNSPDSAYGSVGLVESPRNSPKSDFCMPQSLSPRYQDHVEPDVLQLGNFRHQFFQGNDYEVPSWQLGCVTPEVPQVPLNIPTHEVPSLQYVELLDISCPQNITTYNIAGCDGDDCLLNLPTSAQLPPISCAPPMNINVQEPLTEKKKTNQRISPPKNNPLPLLSSGPCNVKPSNRKITDRTLQKRLESMMKPLRKEAVWKKTIIETLEEFCKKNEQGRTPLMKLLLFEPRLPSLVEAVYTRIGRIKSEKLADLLCHRDEHGHCALYQAATLHFDIPEIAAYIAETYASFGCDVNKPYKNGNTILHYLAQLGDKFDRVLDELLRLSVNGERIFRIDQRNDAGNTPLHVAAEYHLTGTAGSTFSIASTLIKHRGSVCIQNSVGATPLHVAAKSKSCQPEYFRKLLEQRGAENMQDENGNTPLHLVALSVNVHNVDNLKKVIDHLRTSKARTDIKNKAGQCPLDNVHQQCKEVIKNVVQPKRQ